MTYKTFEDLEVWQNARILCKDIYVVTREDKFQKDYRFVSQITASAGSIMDNIAEGFERDGNKEFLQFHLLKCCSPLLCPLPDMQVD